MALHLGPPGSAGRADVGLDWTGPAVEMGGHERGRGPCLGRRRGGPTGPGDRAGPLAETVDRDGRSLTAATERGPWLRRREAPFFGGGDQPVY